MTCEPYCYQRRRQKNTEYNVQMTRRCTRITIWYNIFIMYIYIVHAMRLRLSFFCTRVCIIIISIFVFIFQLTVCGCTFKQKNNYVIHMRRGRRTARPRFCTALYSRCCDNIVNIIIILSPKRKQKAKTI